MLENEDCTEGDLLHNLALTSSFNTKFADMLELNPDDPTEADSDDLQLLWDQVLSFKVGIMSTSHHAIDGGWV